MACNDPYHEIFADVIAYMEQPSPLYMISVRNPDGSIVRKRIPSYNTRNVDEALELLATAVQIAVSEVAAGTRNGFDLIRIDRDAERLERRAKGKRFGAMQRRLDAIGKGRQVDIPRDKPAGGFTYQDVVQHCNSKR